MKDHVLNVINILAMLLAATAFYFNDASAVKERMAIVETKYTNIQAKVDQEMRGYEVLQSSLGIRLDRLERKIDCLINDKMCK